MTALHFAVGSRQSREKALRDFPSALLQHPCFRPCVTARNGIAEHFAAASDRRREIVAAILGHSRFTAFDVVASRTCFNALHLASWEGYDDIVSTILASSRFACLNAVDRQGHSALHLASLKGHVAVATLLLASERFLMTDTAAQNGQTSLHCAAQMGHVVVVELLLHQPRFTEVNAKEEATGATALHEASSSGHAEITALLLADPRCRSQRNKHGRFALHEAARRGHSNVVEAFIQNGRQSLCWESIAGQTALHVAVDWGHMAVVRLLVMQDLGSSVRVRDEAVRSAADLAEARGHSQILSLLKDSGRGR